MSASSSSASDWRPWFDTYGARLLLVARQWTRSGGLMPRMWCRRLLCASGVSNVIWAATPCRCSLPRFVGRRSICCAVEIGAKSVGKPMSICTRSPGLIPRSRVMNAPTGSKKRWCSYLPNSARWSCLRYGADLPSPKSPSNLICPPTRRRPAIDTRSRNCAKPSTL